MYENQYFDKWKLTHRNEDYLKVSYYDMIFLGISTNSVAIVYQPSITDDISLIHSVMPLTSETVSSNAFIGIVKVEVNIRT